MPGATAIVQRGAEKVANPRDAAPDTTKAVTGNRHRHSRANGPTSSNAYTSGVIDRYTPPSAAALLAPTTWKKPATTAAPTPTRGWNRPVRRSCRQGGPQGRVSSMRPNLRQPATGPHRSVV